MTGTVTLPTGVFAIRLALWALLADYANAVDPPAEAAGSPAAPARPSGAAA